MASNRFQALRIVEGLRTTIESARLTGNYSQDVKALRDAERLVVVLKTIVNEQRFSRKPVAWDETRSVR
jgi:hypothetical protein